MAPLDRRYPIEDLAENGDMVDCAHLLLRGTLPTRSQRRSFITEARGHRMVGLYELNPVDQ